MADTSWAADKVERRSVDELIPYDRNPKIHPDSQIEALANSIREWGWTVPILIDEDGTVLAGHGRLYAAQHMGLEEVPCMVADGWTEEKKRAYVIADNKLAERGEWDNTKLYAELKELSQVGFELELTGIGDAFNFMEYKPNLEPSYTYNEVSDSSLEKAQQGMSGAISAIQEDKSSGGTEVMCPYCAETFKFSGV